MLIFLSYSTNSNSKRKHTGLIKLVSARNTGTRVRKEETFARLFAIMRVTECMV